MAQSSASGHVNIELLLEDFAWQQFMDVQVGQFIFITTFTYFDWLNQTFFNRHVIFYLRACQNLVMTNFVK
jgi:hypothetical protein